MSDYNEDHLGKYRMEVFRTGGDLSENVSPSNALRRFRQEAGPFARYRIDRLTRIIESMERALSAANSVRQEMVRTARLQDQLRNIDDILLVDHIKRRTEILDSLEQRRQVALMHELERLRLENERIKLEIEQSLLRKQYKSGNDGKDVPDPNREKSKYEKIAELKEELEVGKEYLRSKGIADDSPEMQHLINDYENRIHDLE